jgi:hypothetical protein
VDFEEAGGDTKTHMLSVRKSIPWFAEVVTKQQSSKSVAAERTYHWFVISANGVRYVVEMAMQ